VGRRAVYDDVGFSGATIDRPALQQLLDDIAAGRVDTWSSTRSTG
jgi:site-specific DNA recombinase